MILHQSHPARHGIKQIIWRLRMFKLPVDGQAALGVAEATERLIEERAEQSRAMFARLGYQVIGDGYRA